MRRDWVANGIKSGLIAAGATAGALSGLGLRSGAGLRPFTAIGAVVLGGAAAARWAFAAAVLGILLHAAVTTAWAVTHAFLIARVARRPWFWGLALGVASLLLSGAVARASGAGVASLLSRSDRIEVALVLIVALPLGMRFANSSRSMDRTRWDPA